MSRIAQTAEEIFNRLSWRKLGVQNIEQAKVLPAEFHLGADLSALNALADRRTTLATAPFALSPVAKEYLASLRFEDLAHLKHSKVDSALPLLRGVKHEYGAHSIDYIDPQGLARFEPARMFQTLLRWLPDKPGRTYFARELMQLSEKVIAQHGNLSLFVLGFAGPYMPSPTIHHPHEDGAKGLRVLVNMSEARTLALPWEQTAKYRKAYDNNLGGDGESDLVVQYPSFTELAARGVKIFGLQPYHANAWRMGHHRGYGSIQNPRSLAHAIPPTTERLRTTLTLSVPNPRFAAA